MVAILVVAHTPLASALEACAKHVLGKDPDIQVFDIQADECAASSAPRLAEVVKKIAHDEGVLILTDLPGATPSNIAVTALKMIKDQGIQCHVLGGVNASMLLKALNYRNATLDVVVDKALAGATQAVLRVD